MGNINMKQHPLSVPLHNKMLRTVGDKKQIAMRRKEIETSDHLFNMSRVLPFQRRHTGSIREGLQIEGSDIDMLFYLKDHRIVWNHATSLHYNPITETVILAEYQESTPGTVYLRLLNIHPYSIIMNTEICTYIRKNNFFYLSSSMFLEMTGFGYYGNGIIKHGPCQRSVDPNDGKECDTTIGFEAREWPTDQTKHWLTRCEKFGWPQKKVLEKILSSGCHFVPIGSKQSRQENNPNPELEWRLSFNQAEEKLIDSMSHSQFLCYVLLKIFLKEVLNKNVKEEEKLLCSYFLKTAMFWCIQADPVHEWSRDNFYPCFWKCFKMLLQWVYTGYCPNFFIPENNLFVCTIVGANQEKLFTQMYDLYCLKENCLALIPSLSKIINGVLANPMAD
uniref:Uncharacterized protein LOC111132434 n=1 Tax=Crassostrea virginica TaxID=6565 RepID=A0A8B8E8L4_CRAVI|nr:uncharacterized protein LOC111132434 [Crassostrea virginica]